jgi:hypothetical protein
VAIKILNDNISLRVLRVPWKSSCILTTNYPILSYTGKLSFAWTSRSLCLPNNKSRRESRLASTASLSTSRSGHRDGSGDTLALEDLDDKISGGTKSPHVLVALWRAVDASFSGALDRGIDRGARQQRYQRP